MDDLEQMRRSVESQGGLLGAADQEVAALAAMLEQGMQHSRIITAHVHQAAQQQARPQLVVAGLAMEACAREEKLEGIVAQQAQKLEALEQAMASLILRLEIPNGEGSAGG